MASALAAWSTAAPSPSSGSRPPPPWRELLDGTPSFDGELIVDSLRAELEREWAALLDAQAALLASAAKPVAGELEPLALSDERLREPLQLALGSVDAEEARWREAALALEARWRTEMHAMTERWRAEDEARLRATLEEAGNEGRRREQLLATLASKPRRGWARLLEAAGLRGIGAMRVACAWRDTCLACQSVGAAPGTAPGSSCAAGSPSTAAGVGAPPLHGSSSSRSSSCRLGGGIGSPILRASWLSALVWTLQREAAAARAQALAARVAAVAGCTRKSGEGVALNVAVNGEGVAGDSDDDKAKALQAAADGEEEEEEEGEAEAAEAEAAVNGGGPAWEGDVGDAISEALERAHAAHAHALHFHAAHVAHAAHVEQATTHVQATHLPSGGSGGNSSRRVSGVGDGVDGVGGVGGGGGGGGGGGVGEAETVAGGLPHGAALCLLLMLIGDASAEERLAALTDHWIVADETLPGLLPHRRRPRDAGVNVNEPPLMYAEQLLLLSHVRAAATMAVVAAASLAQKGMRTASKPASPTDGARGGAYLSPQALLSPPPPPPPLTASPSDAGSSRRSSSVIQYVGSGSRLAAAAAQAAAVLASSITTNAQDDAALASSITTNAQDDASAHALISAEATAELFQILSQRPDTWAVSPPGVRQFLLWLAATEAAVGEVLAGGTELASATGAASGAPHAPDTAPEDGEWTLLGHAARMLREQVTPLLAGTMAEFVGPYVHAGLTVYRPVYSE